MRHQSRTTRNLILAAGSIIPLAILASCASDDQQSLAAQDAKPTYARPAPVWTGEGRPITESLGPRNTNANTSAQLVSQRRLTAERPPNGLSPELFERQPGELIRVKYAARAAKADEVLQVIVGEYLGRDYVIDPKITGNITIDIDQEMTRQDIMDLLGGLCMLHGWSVAEHADVLHIRQAADIAKAADVPILHASTALGTDEPAIRVRTMHYLGASEVTSLLTDLMSNGAKVAAVGQTVILVDTMRQLNKVARVLAALDVPAFNNVEIWTYKLASRSPENAAQLLSTLASETGLISGPDPIVAFVPIPGSDRMMVVSRDPSAHTIVRDLIAEIDAANSATTRWRKIYRIQHYDPTQLKSILEQTFAERMEKSNNDAADTGIRLVLDADNDFMIIHATPDDYAELMQTIQAIDRPPMQVRVQSIILEVELNDALEYGVEYFLNAFDEEGLGVLDLTGAAGVVADPTGSAFFVGGDGLAVVTALETVSDVEILSRPELFIVDNGTGEFQDGGEVPYVAADVDTNVQTDGSTGIRREIEYRDTGVSLTITPKINESGHIHLEIDQEITAVGSESDLGPEFNTRAAKTTVIVPHGTTIMIGGIIRTENRKVNERIPLLADIPLLGAAFQGVSDRQIKSELLLAITPTIIEHPRLIGTEADGMSDFLRRANGVRTALEALAEDPNDGAIIQDAPFAPPKLDAPPIEDEPEADQAEPEAQTTERSDGPPPMPPILEAILGGRLSNPTKEEPQDTPEPPNGAKLD